MIRWMIRLRRLVLAPEPIMLAVNETLMEEEALMFRGDILQKST